MPDWLIRIEVARYLGCKPWELDEVPPVWQDWGLIALHVHNDLQTPTERES